MTVAGTAPRGRASLLGVAEWTDEYRRAELTAGARRAVGKLTTEGSLRLGAATAGAPLTSRFALGGVDGFAGLHIGERLAFSTLSGAVDAGYPIVGPLGGVVTLMAGTSGTDPARVLAGRWAFGARVGVGTDSPIGPVRLQYGLADGGRQLWFLRVGRWF